MAARDLTPRLYAADITPLLDPQLYAAAYNAVSPQRRQKADLCRLELDRCRSVGAELLLRYALQQSGDPLWPPDYIYNAYEKPALKNSDIRFNLSHSGSYALCAVAPCDVGCDIETVAPVDLKVAKRFFCPAEYEDILLQPTPEAQQVLFFRYWTLKESFLKATGCGLQLPLNSFQIIRSPEISVCQTADDRTYSFAEFDTLPGCRCALCAASDCSQTLLLQVDLEDILKSCF